MKPDIKLCCENKAKCIPLCLWEYINVRISQLKPSIYMHDFIKFVIHTWVAPLAGTVQTVSLADSTNCHLFPLE